MKPDDIRKLLGGYATGTLTGEEREALYAAALEDQSIFDALADEEALRDLLADPAYRAELARDLAGRPPSLGERILAWWRRPAPLALTGAFAAAAVVIFIVAQGWQHAGDTVQVAMHKQEEPVPSLAGEEVLRDEAPAEPPKAESPAPAVARDEAKGVGKFHRDAPAETSFAEQPAEAEEASPPKPLPPPPAEPESRLEELGAADSGAASPVRQLEERDLLAKRRSPSPARRKSAQVGETLDVAAPEGDAEAQLSAAPRSAQLSVASLVAPPLFQCRLMIGGLPVSLENEAQLPAVSISDAVSLRVSSQQPGYVYVLVTPPGANPVLVHTATIGAGTSAVPASGALSLPPVSGEQTLTVLYSGTALSLPDLGVEGEPDLSTADAVRKFTILYR